MATLSQEMLGGISEIITELGSPTFSWNNNSYPCIASVSQFNRDLAEGGFTIEQLLTMTVPRYDADGNPTFPNDTPPQAQMVISFNGNQYRIESIKTDAIYDYDTSNSQTNNGTRFRIAAVSANRGI